MENRLEKIDFYILTNGDYQSFACRLLEKAYQEKMRVFVLTENETLARELNDLLWTFRDISFVPHQMANDPNSATAAIFINYVAPYTEEAEHYDILLNLSSHLPETYVYFPRLILIVPEESDWKNAAREQYKQLTQQGYSINTHKMS